MKQRANWGVLGGAVFFLLGVAGHSQGLTTVPAEEVGISSQRLSRLEEVLQGAIEEGLIPGAVALVGRRGKIVYRWAGGKQSMVPRPEPMGVDVIFDVASLTKVLATAPAILVLVEEGRLSLTDPVSNYLPGFAVHGKDSITLLQLLTHFSGLRADLDLDGTWEGYQTGVEMALEERPVAPAGSEFRYSDVNYILLGEIVRVVSGQTLDVFARERIFQPLSMDHTRFNPPVQWRNRIVPTEKRDGVMLRGTVHDPTSYRMGGVAGHAGLFSTADDIARFATMVLNSGRGNGQWILSPFSVRAMTTPQTPPGATDLRGLGFDIRTPFSGSRGDLFPIGSYGHTGFTGTSLWMDPLSQSFVILLTSRLHPNGEGNVVALRKRVASVVAASIMDLSVGPEEHSPEY